MIPVVLLKTDKPMEKIAVPWGAILKGVTAIGGKALANPLSRRALIGAGIGGAGNLALGSPQQGSLAKRFLAGAAIGAAGGAGYHGATRLGMPTATTAINKAVTKAKPIYNRLASMKVPTVLKPKTISLKFNNGVWT